MNEFAPPRVVVVTGASAGVGRATARAFARSGAAVGLVARGTPALDRAAEEVAAEGVPAVGIAADVADARQVDAAAARVERELGPIDAWVNDAMVTVFSPFSRIDADEFRRVTDVTYLGVVNGTRSALDRMRTRGRGSIVQVGSALAYRGIPLQSAYCGAKHAIRGFTDSLRCELRHERSSIRVTMVQLPALNTPQFGWSRTHMSRRARPVPPIYQPEIAADAIVWASRHARREVIVGGTAAATILAQKIAPGLLERYLAATGFRAQQTDEAEDPLRPDNLYAPVPDDVGAHGRFDARSHAHSAQWWFSKHRTVLPVVSALGIALVVGRHETAAPLGDRTSARRGIRPRRVGAPAVSETSR